jgi:hypothetical protein
MSAYQQISALTSDRIDSLNRDEVIEYIGLAKGITLQD